MADIEFELPSSMLPNTTDAEIIDDNITSRGTPDGDIVSETSKSEAAGDKTTENVLQVTDEGSLNDTPVEIQESNDDVDVNSETTLVLNETPEEKPNGLLEDTEDHVDKPNDSGGENIIEVDWPSFVDKYSKMFTTKQLRDKLRDNGLVTSGTKGQMISRLHEHGVSLEDDEESIEISS